MGLKRCLKLLKEIYEKNYIIGNAELLLEVIDEIDLLESKLNGGYYL